jgi:hypothetical protein
MTASCAALGSNLGETALRGQAVRDVRHGLLDTGFKRHCRGRPAIGVAVI